MKACRTPWSSAVPSTAKHPLIVRGEGCFLYDADGKQYLDGSGGAFAANLGHGLTEIGEAMARQAAKAAGMFGVPAGIANVFAIGRS